MIRLIILLLASVLFDISGTSQDRTPILTIGEVSFEDNRYAQSRVHTQLKARLKKNFEITPYSFIKLSTNINLGDIKTINGMDSYVTTNADITYTLTANDLPTQSLEETIKTKGTNVNELRNNLGLSIVRDKKHIESLIKFIHDYLDQHISSCEQISSLVQSKIDLNDLGQAYALTSLYATHEDCDDALGASLSAIESKHQEYACDQIIQQCSVLANGPNIGSLKEAIGLLQVIPPTAPCAEEAIRLSSVISDNAQKINSYQSKKIVDQIVVINARSEDEWRSWYQDNYMSLYNRN